MQGWIVKASGPAATRRTLPCFARARTTSRTTTDPGRPAVTVLVVIALGRSERNLTMTWLRSLSPLLVVLLPSAAWAQDVASGPEKDTKGPALKVFDATGPHADRGSGEGGRGRLEEAGRGSGEGGRGRLRRRGLADR